jgi:hypothetical protein
MSVFSVLGTLLATIPGFALGTNVFTPENPQVDPSATLPLIKVQRISGHSEARLDGARIYNQDRVQITMVAATAVALEALKAAIEAKLDYNRTSFMGSFPLGYGLDGFDSVPTAYWITGDWLILY